MSWIRLDDGFPRHRRVRELRKDIVAKWLHVVALCHCGEHLTDGFIDEIALEQIINDAGVPLSAAKRAIPKLVEVGLWIEHDGRDVYLIRDYLDYNPTSHDVKEKREQARERMQRVRANKTRTNGEVRVPPAPTPSPTRSSALRELDEKLRDAA